VGADLFGLLLVIFIGGGLGFYLVHQKLDTADDQRRYIIKRIKHLEEEWECLRGRLPLSPEDQARIEKMIEGHKSEQSVDAIISGLGQTRKDT
jgi:hypothetical protein